MGISDALSCRLSGIFLFGSPLDAVVTGMCKFLCNCEEKANDISDGVLGVERLAKLKPN